MNVFELIEYFKDFDLIGDDKMIWHVLLFIEEALESSPTSAQYKLLLNFLYSNLGKKSFFFFFSLALIFTYLQIVFFFLFFFQSVKFRCIQC